MDNISRVKHGGDVGEERGMVGVKLLDVRKVAAMLSIHPRSVWRLAAAGRIPRPIRLAEKTLRWRLVDLQQHLAELAGD